MYLVKKCCVTLVSIASKQRLTEQDVVNRIENGNKDYLSSELQRIATLARELREKAEMRRQYRKSVLKVFEEKSFLDKVRSLIGR